MLKEINPFLTISRIIGEKFHINHQCNKGFWPRLCSAFCLGFRTEAYWGETKRGCLLASVITRGVKALFCFGCRGTRTIGSTIFFLIKNFAEPLTSVMVRTEAIYPVTTHQQPSIINKPILNKPILFRFTHFPLSSS